ncbi:hypothetical protein SAMN04488120_10241 [Fontimonas thermophila]|uniref:FimV N-terminal domain-containing protein n=2 Tax=Fontimonas thermophila TaxID=1076937 RepID=A0A1I2HNQ8_9GAMM|nr:hypothetical protein SAMN04488120_10241 [Fontimonas thermophila]
MTASMIRIVARSFPRVTLCGALMCLGGTAHALGIGEPEVRSRLGQPLFVRAPLQLAEGERIEDIALRLPRDAYAPMGLPIPPEALLSATVQARMEDGMPWLIVSSPVRIHEPIIVLVVEARIDGTRLLRELTLLIEPPATTDGPAAASHQEPAIAASVPAAPAASGESPTSTSGTGPVSTDDGTQYGPTVAGETLRSIAERVGPQPRFGIRRVMAALRLANPDLIDDIHQPLPPGRMLKVPTAQEMLRLSAAQIDAAVGPRRNSAVQSEPPQRVMEPAAPAAAISTTHAPEALAATHPAPPAVERIATPYGRLRLSTNLSELSLGRLSAGSAGPVPGTPPSIEIPSSPAPTALEQAPATVAIPAPDVSGQASTPESATQPAAAHAASRDDGQRHGSGIWWLLAVAAGVALALWRWLSAAGTKPAPRAPATRAAMTASAGESSLPQQPEPPLRGGELDSRDTTPIAALRQRADRVRGEVADAAVQRRITLVHAYLDAGDLASAEQLLDEIEEGRQTPRAASNG